MPPVARASATINFLLAVTAGVCAGVNFYISGAVGSLCHSPHRQRHKQTANCARRNVGQARRRRLLGRRRAGAPRACVGLLLRVLRLGAQAEPLLVRLGAHVEPQDHVRHKVARAGHAVVQPPPGCVLVDDAPQLHAVHELLYVVLDAVYVAAAVLEVHDRPLKVPIARRVTLFGLGLADRHRRYVV